MRILALTILAAGACSAQPEAAQPEAAEPAANVCWRVLEVVDGEPRVQAVVRDIPNLETCAVRIEGLRMIEERPVTGLYNAHYIFATETGLTASPGLDGARVRVFDAERRQEIQAELRRLMAEEAAGEVEERRGPRTVVAPPPITEG
ncbi:hypothetical protein [Brevundimonas lutea]|uniref:hypothetical protein n=1 Tax=Brevundimonas lutea TaxID=2293980 RepID=UPI000F03A521|nr:hypothetical protein [Brevundimonas lutea]